MKKTILNAALLAAPAGQSRQTEARKTNPMQIAMRNAADFARKVQAVRSGREGIGGA